MRTERDRLRFAVIGVGHIAQVAVLPAFGHARRHAELTALVSSDPEKREVLSQRHRVPFTCAYDEFDELAAGGQIDAVYITLPNHLHREWTERAAAHGLHVLCEKPMAVTEEDCRAMIDVTRQKNVSLMIAYRLHFESVNLRAVAMVQEGVIGNPVAFSSTFTHQVRPGDIRTRAETGGGALFDLGVYCVNAARYLFREEPIEVFAWTQGAAESPSGDGQSQEVDETTVAQLRFASGRTAQFTVSQGLASSSHYRVIGERGELVVEPAYDYSKGLALRLTTEDRTRRVRRPQRDQFAPQLIHFVESIRRNEPPGPSGEEGLADVRVLEAIVTSARERRPVSLEPFEVPRRPSPSQAMDRPAVEKPETVNAPAPHD
jgi:predicted dehydrogenase